MNTETKTEIISKKEELEIRNKMRAEMVEQLTAKIDAKQKELETKKYIIEGGAPAGEMLSSFLKEQKGYIPKLYTINYSINDTYKLLLAS